MKKESQLRKGKMGLEKRLSANGGKRERGPSASDAKKRYYSKIRRHMSFRGLRCPERG